MSLWQMSLYGTIMILVIAVLRQIFMNRLPKLTFLILWVLVLVRLLIPFQIPSAFSVYSVLPEPVWIIGEEITEQIGEKPSAENTGGKAADSEISKQQRTYSELENSAGKETGETTAAIEEDRETDADTGIIHILWAAGVCLCSSYFFSAYRKCRKEFQTALPVKSEFTENWLAAHPLKRKMEIRSLDGMETPLTYGILRPVILLPKRETTERTESVSYVLEHEFVHIKRGDAAVKLLMTAALCIHWYNPFVWLMYVLFNRDIELSCDEAVLRRLGEAQRASYAYTLIGMEEKRSGFVPFYSSFNRNAMEERITAIMKTKKKTAAAGICAVILVGAVAIGFATTSVSKETEEDGLLTRISAGEIPMGDIYVDFADDSLLVFHDVNHGMFFYSIEEKRLLDAVDWTQFDCDGSEESLIAVNKDISEVYIRLRKSGDCYIYDTQEKELRKQTFDLDKIPDRLTFYFTKDYVNPDYTVGRSENCIPLGDEQYLYVECGSGIMHDMYYVIENGEGERETGDIFPD